MPNVQKLRKLLRRVVGPWGLEPQTSTVSICGPHDYRLLLKATNLMFFKEITSFLSPP